MLDVEAACQEHQGPPQVPAAQQHCLQRCNWKKALPAPPHPSLSILLSHLKHLDLGLPITAWESRGAAFGHP